MKAVREKSLNKIREEWDDISPLRYRQITHGTDLSYKHVILPCILGLSKNSDFSAVVDVGCGTGVLDAKLSPYCKKIVGIDFSSKSIDIAKNHCKRLDNTVFENTAVENYAAQVKSPMFTLAVANMTLMTCIDLSSILGAVKKLVVPGGTFAITLTHPCFWPRYWGYEKAKWFDYKKEIIIEAPFRISQETTNCITTHVHRPLHMYVNVLNRFGFVTDRLLEPIPDRQIQKRYPESWRFPRFIGIKCIKKER